VSGAQYVITSVDHLETVKVAIRGVKRDIEIIIFSDLLRPDGNLNLRSCGYRTLHELLASPGSPALETRLKNIHAGTVATLMSTSGTTGLPKMAQRTHRAIVAESRSDERYDSTKPYTIRGLYCTPMFHAYSFPKMVINPLRQGLPTYYMARFDDSFAQRVSQYQITDTITVPPILSRLVEQARKEVISQDALRSLRSIVCAGAPMPEKLRTEFLELFNLQTSSLVQEWGMTECGCITREPYSENDTSGSVGAIVGGYQVKVDIEQTIECSDGRVVGELLAKGPQLMIGYQGNAAATAQAFATGGWYRTGDVGYVSNASGKLYLVDRVKDIIKTNGWQISPAELEAAVLRFPGIADACALSMGHSLDEHPQIFVVKGRDDITERQIKEHMRVYLSRYKIESCTVRFVDILPRAPSGKVLRRILRTQLLEEGAYV
jgi:acyl-CoA synthetase (AMP-forming)/AMP-acid ligase II